MAELIPHDEENDSLVVAEAAMKGCSILLSSDNDLDMGGKSEGLWKILESSHTASSQLIVASPREIVRKFVRNR